MADFEKNVSLIEVDVDVTAAKKQVDGLTGSILAQKDAVKANTDQIKSLEKQNKELEKEVKAGTKSRQEANKQIAENSKKSFELKKANESVKDGIKDLNKERAAALKATKLQANSLDALRKKSNDLKKTLNAQGTATEAGRKKFDDLQKELKETNEQIRDLDQGASDFKTTVGKYPKAMDGATQATGLFGSGLSGVFKMILTNPIGILLGALVGLVAVFKESQTGAEFFRKAGAVLNTALGKLADVVEFLGGALIEAFSNPKQTIMDLIDTIENGIVKYFTEFIPNAIQTTLDGFGLLGKAVKAVFEGDFDAAMEAGKESVKLLADGLTDLNPVTAALKTGFEAAVPAMQDFIAETNKATEGAWGLEEAMIANEKAIADQEVQVAKSIQSQKELDEIIKDQSLTFEERLAASEEFARVEQEQIDKTVALQEERLRILKAQNDLTNSTEEDIQRVRDAEIQLANLQAESASRRTKNTLQFNTIRKQQVKEEKALKAREAKAQEDLNIKLAELEAARLDEVQQRQLKELEGTTEFYTKKRDIENEAFNTKVSDLEEQEAQLAEQNFEFEEQRLAAQAEIDLQKEEARREHEENLTAIKEEESAKRVEAEKKEGEAVSAELGGSLKAAKAIGAAATASINNEHKKRLGSLEKQLESGQISEEDFAKKKEELDKKTALKEYQVKKKQFVLDQVTATGTAVMNTAQAITKTAANLGFPAAIPFVALAGAQGVAQLAEISSRQPPAAPTFADGGQVIQGRSHAQGGEDIYVGGRLVGNMEGGEGLYVTNKAATANILNDYNTSAGGRSMFSNSHRFLQDGGQVDTSSAGMSAEQLAAALGSMPVPVVDVSSIIAGINAEGDAKKIGVV